MNNSTSMALHLCWFITLGSLPRNGIAFSNNMNIFMISDTYWRTSLKNSMYKYAVPLKG